MIDDFSENLNQKDLDELIINVKSVKKKMKV